MKRVIAAAALALISYGCNSSTSLTGPTADSTGDVRLIYQAGTAVTGGGGGAALGSIYRQGNNVVFVIQGAQRSDYCLELWDMAVHGTSRTGTPEYRSCGKGNGTHTVDASKFACLRLQADVGGPGGGLLAYAFIDPWGSCPKPPKPLPTPTPCPEPNCTPGH